jgi:glycosyltransferase involved in cell wall biosynthesis
MKKVSNPNRSSLANAPVTALFVGSDAKYMHQFRGRLIEALAGKGYRTIVLATPVSGFEADAYSNLGAEFLPWSLQRTRLNPLADIRSLLTLWRALRSTRADLVFSHTIKSVIYTMVLAKLAGVPRRVAMLPGLGVAFSGGTTIRKRMTGFIARVGYRLALRSSSLVILQNNDDRKLLQKMDVLSPRTNVSVVNGSGVDMTHFSASPLPEGPITFLMVARLIVEKGVGDFVDAARQVKSRAPATRFILVGGRDDSPASVTQAEIDAWRQEGIVEIWGQVADPKSAYAQCHVFVLPSYYREGVPRTNLEAMSSARAIITTDMPGCRETVVDGVNGLIVPPRSPTALANAMLAAASDRERLRVMGEAGRVLCAERFELGAVTRETVALMIGT